MISLDQADDKVASILRDWREMEVMEAAIAVCVGIAAIVLVTRLVPWLAERLPDRFRFFILPWGPILRLVLLLLLIIYVVPLILVPTPQNLFAVFGAAAVALGFAIKDYANSLLAGIVALCERPYRPGDWVRIGADYGEVKALGFRNVELVTPDDTVVAIPHSSIWTQAVHNSNAGKRDLMCVADFFLDPRHEGAAVLRALRDVAMTSPYVNLKRPAPVTVIAAERMWATHYEVKAYPIDSRDQFLFITDLTLRGKEALLKLGAAPAAVTSATWVER
jgi:small-conductance mechanosensitive channel